jgi:toxin ParE1/3/4
MDFKIVWSEGAIADLHQICSHIAEDNSEAALRVGRNIIDHVGVLGSFPFIGPTYPRGSLGPLREIVYRPYRIFYDVSEDTRRVEILHIRHGARQEPEFGAA